MNKLTWGCYSDFEVITPFEEVVCRRFKMNKLTLVFYSDFEVVVPFEDVADSFCLALKWNIPEKLRGR